MTFMISGLTLDNQSAAAAAEGEAGTTWSDGRNMPAAKSGQSLCVLYSVCTCRRLLHNINPAKKYGCHLGFIMFVNEL